MMNLLGNAEYLIPVSVLLWWVYDHRKELPVVKKLFVAKAPPPVDVVEHPSFDDEFALWREVRDTLGERGLMKSHCGCLQAWRSAIMEDVLYLSTETVKEES